MSTDAQASSLHASASSGTPEASDAALQGVCAALRQAFPGVDVHGVSLYDSEGVLLWLTAAFGPQEDEAIRKARGKFAGGSGDAVYVHELGQARTAVVFRVINARRQVVGVAMVVADTRVILPQRRNPAALLTATVQRVLEQFAATRGEPKRFLQIRPSGPPSIPVLQTVVEPRQAGKPERTDVRLYVQSLIALQTGSTATRHELFLGTRAGATFRRIHGSDSRIERKLITSLQSLLARDPRVGQGCAPKLSVRLGKAALADDRFIRWFDQALKQAPVPTGTIAFEVDAAETIRDIARIRKVAAFFHRAGCTLALDNFRLETECFGLLCLPGVQLVTLAPSVTAQPDSSELSVAGIVAVTAMLRKQQILTAARNVDTPEECNRIRALGFDFARSDRASPPKRLKVQ